MAARPFVAASKDRPTWFVPLLLATIAAALLGGFITYLAVGHSSSTPSPAGITSPPAGVVAAAPTPSHTQSALAYADLTLTGQECGRSGSGAFAAAAAGNDYTSCPFALSVQQAYMAADVQGRTATVRAFSPVTHKWYDMACSGSEPATCTGGTNYNAIVYLYGGPAEFTK